MLRRTILGAALAASMALAAQAATLASAVTPLNIRSGPGPEYNVIGAIPVRGQATVIGCIQGSLWCQVNFNGKQGWAYSQYLTADVAGRSVVLSEDIAQIPAATYEVPAATVGSAVVARPSISGTLVVPPANAQPLALNPPPTVNTYIVSHPLNPVYLNGEVVEGVGLPPDVALSPVPGYDDYQYAYVNSVPVLVEPRTRRVTYVYR